MAGEGSGAAAARNRRRGGAPGGDAGGGDAGDDGRDDVPEGGGPEIPVNVVVRNNGLDFVIPTIEEPSDEDIICRFVFKELDRIDGEPNYHALINLRNQMVRNALK